MMLFLIGPESETRGAGALFCIAFYPFDRHW
jgi:hypothetical protein